MYARMCLERYYIRAKSDASPAGMNVGLIAYL